MMLKNNVEGVEISEHTNNMISFESTNQNYCVGIVDIVNSTQNIAKLSQDKACTYYSVFLNTIGYVIQSNGGKVVKNIGDGILFYFPKQSNVHNFDVPLDCGIKILDALGMINSIFSKKKIPAIHYRVSLDYGPLMIAKYSTSSCSDIFGPTVNLCAKINHLAKKDQLIVGGDMYQITKKSKEYKFKQVEKFQSILKQDYPVYSVNTTYEKNYK